MTINNLFSIFDPVTLSPNIAMNWLSLFAILLIPSSYWLTKSKSSYLMHMIFSFFSKELKMVLSLKSGSSSLFLISFFFFIWVNNVPGIFPYVFTGTSHLSITMSLALPLWAGYFIINFIYNPSSTLAHLVPNGTPLALVPFMVVIETLSTFMRPMTLSIRLAANMVAGHLLLSLLSSPMVSSAWAILPVLFVGLSLLMLLELSVTFIQSYVFMTLSSLYISEVNNPNNSLSSTNTILMSYFPFVLKP